MTPLPPFWLLVQAHGGELHTHARRLAGDDADDVVQDALLRALRAYPSLTSADHLRAWLHRIVFTTAADHHRKRRRRAEIPTGDLPEVAAPPSSADGDGSFDALIAPLPDGARAALTLRFVEDLEYDVIGRRLNCSSAAARQRVSTALKTLRERLA